MNIIGFHNGAFCHDCATKYFDCKDDDQHVVVRMSCSMCGKVRICMSAQLFKPKPQPKPKRVNARKL